MFGEFRSRALHQRKPAPIGNDQVIQFSGNTPAQDGGALSKLVTQPRGLINAASRAIVASTREPPSAITAMLARIIVSEAKKQRPDDGTIQGINLEVNIPDWNEISAAMNIIVKALA